MSRNILSRARPFAVLLLAALAAGCGSGRYPVEGRVAYEDGAPVDAGTVIGEATVDGVPVSAQGTIAPDGSFKMGTERPGDGVPPGSYRFVVMPVPLPDGPSAAGKVLAVDGKFSKFDSSGIKLDVKPEKNVLNITVPRPKAKPAARGN